MEKYILLVEKPVTFWNVSGLFVSKTLSQMVECKETMVTKKFKKSITVSHSHGISERKSNQQAKVLGLTSVAVGPHTAVRGSTATNVGPRVAYLLGTVSEMAFVIHYVRTLYSGYNVIKSIRQ